MPTAKRFGHFALFPWFLHPEITFVLMNSMVDKLGCSETLHFNTCWCDIRPRLLMVDISVGSLVNLIIIWLVNINGVPIKWLMYHRGEYLLINKPSPCDGYQSHHLMYRVHIYVRTCMFIYTYTHHLTLHTSRPYVSVCVRVFDFLGHKYIYLASIDHHRSPLMTIVAIHH